MQAHLRHWHCAAQCAQEPALAVFAQTTPARGALYGELARRFASILLTCALINEPAEARAMPKALIFEISSPNWSHPNTHMTGRLEAAALVAWRMG